MRLRDAAAFGQGGQAGDAGGQIAEVAAPGGFFALGKAQKGAARFGVKARHAALLAGVQGQQVVDVGFDVFGPRGQARQVVSPEVDARKKVFAKAPGGHFAPQVAAGAGNELEVAAHFAVAAQWVEALFLDGFEQHGLLVRPQLADFVQKQHAAIGAFEQAGAVAGRAGEGAFFVAEQGGHGPVAVQRGAIDFHELAADEFALTLELGHAPRQKGFARARGAGQQDGRGRAHGHALDFVDQRVKARVARGDAAFEKGHGVALRGLKAPGDGVVARKVQVNERELARLARAPVARRRGLRQHAGQVARFGQQEQTDLRHVRAGGDVHPVLPLVRRPGVAVRPVIERAVDLAKVPGIGNGQQGQAHVGGGRKGGDVALHAFGQPAVALAGVNQLQPRHGLAGLLAQRHGGPPLLPAARAHAAVELRAEKANGRDWFDIHISKSSFEYRINPPAAWPERRGQTPSEKIFSFYFNGLHAFSAACKRRWHAACTEEST